MIVSSILVPIWLYLGITNVYSGVARRFKEEYPIACVLIGLSAITQMLEEPVYYLSARELQAKPKSVSEGTMLVFRYVLFTTTSFFVIFQEITKLTK